MREYLLPAESLSVETSLGLINVAVLSASSVRVDAPHLTVNGNALRAWAFLGGDRVARQYDFIRHIGDRHTSVPPDALGAKLVDGRDADPVLLGKIAEAILPAVNQLASERWAIFLEAERRSLHNEIGGLEQELDHLRERIVAKEEELEATEKELHKLLG